MRTDILLPPACASRAIDDKALDQLFRGARSHNGWLERPGPAALLRHAVDLAKMGQPSGKTLRTRVVFGKTDPAHARLKPRDEYRLRRHNQAVRTQRSARL